MRSFVATGIIAAAASLPLAAWAQCQSPGGTCSGSSIIIGNCSNPNFISNVPITAVANCSGATAQSAGSIVGWCVNLGAGGSNTTVSLRVWRPNGTGGYNCVGSSTKNGLIVGTNCFTLPGIAVQPGDLLGSEAAAGTVMYTGGGCGLAYETSSVSCGNNFVPSSSFARSQQIWAQLCTSDPTRLVFTNAARAITAGGCSGALTLQSQNNSNVATAVTAATTVSLTTSHSATGRFYSDATCSTAITSVVIPLGSSTAPSVYYSDTLAPSATVTGTATGGNTGMTPATQVVTINPGAATKLAFLAQPSNVVAGASISPAVQVVAQDAWGNTATSFTGSITLALGANPGSGTLSGTLTATASAGVATFSNLSINKAASGYTLVASSGTLTPATSNLFNVTAAAAARLAFTVQPSNAAATVAISPAVQVAVQDAFGNTVTSSTATLSVATGANPGGGLLSGTTSRAATAGVASFPDLSIDKAGTGYTLVATSGTLTPATSAAFNITVGAAAQLAFTVQPSNTVSTTSISPAVQVTVQDAGGNTVTTSSAPVTLAIANNPSLGTLSGTLTTNASSGVATFSNLSIDKAGTGYTLRATSTGLTGAVSAAFNILVGPAQRLAFSVQPSNAGSAAAISPAVQVLVLDAGGNTVTASSASIAMAIGNNPGPGTLSGTLSRNAVSGVATFADLSIDVAGTGYTLRATSAGLTGASSAPFNVVSSGPTRVSFNVQPGGAVAGAAIAPAVRVAVLDSGGVVQTSSTASITLALGSNPGGGTLSGTLTRNAVSGVATFDNLSINRAAAGYTLVASSAGLSSATSTPFDISPAPASQLVFGTAPQSLVAGACSPAATAVAQDALGNASPVAAATAVDLSSTSSGATFYSDPGCATAVTSVTLNAGQSAVSLYWKDTAAGAPTLTAQASGLGQVSQAQQVVNAAPAALAFVTPPGTAAAGACSSVATVQSRDPFGNPAPLSSATAVTWASTSSAGGFFSDPSCLVAVTGAVISAGASTASFYYADTAAGAPSLDASGGGFTRASQVWTINPGPPRRLAFAGPPPALLAGDCSGALLIEAQDDYGNRSSVSAALQLTLSSTSSGGSFYATASCGGALGSATLPQGQATATVYYRDTRSGTAQLRATAAGFTDATSTVTVLPAVASRLRFTSPPQQVVAAGCSAAATIASQDAFGNAAPVAQATGVALSSSSGTGGFYSDSACSAQLTAAAIAAGDATATFYWSDLTAGAPTLTASSPPLLPASQAQAVIAGPPARLSFVTAPQSLGAGDCSAAATIELQDSHGNRATAPADLALSLASDSTSVRFSSTPTCGTAVGLLTLPAGSSEATFYWRETRAGAPILRVSAAAFATVSQTQQVTSGTAARLAFSVPPSDAAAGASISPDVAVTVVDGFDNPVTSSAAVVALTLAVNPSGGALAGTVSRAASGGTAVFPGLSLSRAGQGYALLASSSALASATSPSFDIVPGPPSRLVFVTQPTDAVAGAIIAPQVQVAVEDAFGNRVAGSTASVALAIGRNPAGGALSGTASATASAGVASFGDLSIDQPGAGYTLEAASGVLANATSSSFDVLGRPASSLSVSGLPQTIVAGSAHAVTVEALGASGARVTAWRGTVFFGSSDAMATLPMRYTFTAADQGVHAFAGGVTLRTAGLHRVWATDLLDASVSGQQSNLRVVLPDGDTCAGGADCVSGICAGAVCCATACAGPCLSCALAGQRGSCAALADGTACPDVSYCNGAETCRSGACAAGPGVACADPLGREVWTCDEASQSCRSVPDAPPQLVRDASLVAAVGVPYPYNSGGRVRALGALPITYRACGGPPAFRISPTGDVSWTPASSGPVVLCAGAQNAFGSDSYSFTVQVGTAPGAGPVASFTVMPPSGPAPLSAAFDGTASTSDPSTPLTAWRFSFGDFSPLALDPKPTSPFALPGGFRPELVVVDSIGRSDSTRRPVLVTNATGQLPPLARIVLEGDGQLIESRGQLFHGAESLTARFSCSCQEGSAPIAAWLWDFGDSSASGPSVSHVFSPGRYRVRLTAVDTNGNWGQDWIDVGVSGGGDEPPNCRVTLAPPSGLSPLSVVHLLSASDSDGDLQQAQLTFFDGTRSPTEVTRVYGPGRFRVSLAATDDRGLTCYDNVEVITVGASGAIPPRIASLPSGAGSCGVPYRYSETGPVASGTAPFSWSVAPAGSEPLPERLAVDAATGAIAFVPSRQGGATQRFTLRVENAAGSDEQRVEVEVACAGAIEVPLNCGCSSAQALAGVALVVALARRRRGGRR